jgi:transcriptional regulator with XRE-family HTH domain
MAEPVDLARTHRRVARPGEGSWSIADLRSSGYERQLRPALCPQPGLSQRELAATSGVPQSTIGRIEAGQVDPRVGTLRRLLQARGYDLEVEPRLDIGVDRSLVREFSKLTPAEQIRRGAAAGNFIRRLRDAVQQATRSGA